MDQSKKSYSYIHASLKHTIETLSVILHHWLLWHLLLLLVKLFEYYLRSFWIVFNVLVHLIPVHRHLDEIWQKWQTVSYLENKAAIAPCGPGHPSSPLSIYFLIFSPFHFSLSFIGFTYFLLLSIPSLSTRIVPLRFQAGGRRRRPNLVLVCFVLCVICIP